MRRLRGDMQHSDSRKPQHRDHLPGEALVGESDLQYLQTLARNTIGECRTRVTIGGRVYPAYMASGSRQYPAFWTRDAVWISVSGLLTSADVESMVGILARTQNGPEPRELKYGLSVPAWAVADHVLCEDGGAVFFPGTYSAGDDQGDGRFGTRAAQDACYMFIELAYLWHRQTGETSLFEQKIAGVRLLDRLQYAFESPDHDEASGLAVTRLESRSVAFSDAIVKTGFLLDGSILRWRAALRLTCIMSALGQSEWSAFYSEVAARIAGSLPGALWHDTRPDEGWLLSASEIGCQDCVRGTSFALALGILDADHSNRASRALAAASASATLDATPRPGQVTYQGHIRHLRRGEYWEGTPMAPGTYQNGGYWGMFTGWSVRGVAITNRALACELAGVFVEHMRRYSAFDGSDEAHRGAPWEWVHPDGTRIGPLYGPTITLAYRGFSDGFRVDSMPRLTPPC